MIRSFEFSFSMFDLHMNRHEAITRVHSVWDETPAGALCLAVLELISSGVLKRLTFGQLHGLAEQTKADEVDVARAIQYLTGHDLHLLDMEFEFIDDEDDVYYFDPEDLNIARRDGDLHHPETGEAIDNYEERIFITFVPSTLAKEIVADE